MARRDYTRKLEIDYDKLLKEYNKLLRGEKKKMSANTTFLEKVAKFITTIKPKEVMFDKEYVKEIKDDGKSRNVFWYQSIVLFIKVIEKVSMAYIITIVLKIWA